MSRVILLLAFLLLPACGSVGPDYIPPETGMPGTYRAEIMRGLAGAPAELGAWWTRLGDPELDRLVAETLAANLDLRAAMARIDEARARRRIAGNNNPDIQLRSDHRRSQNSQELPGGQFLPRETQRHDSGLDASWEIDLWGRVDREIEAADADLEAAIEDGRSVLVAMAAETAINYVEYRTFQERLRIAESNLAIQARTVGLAETRFETGLVSGLDVAQARTSLESTRALIPPLQAGLRAASNRLAVLGGVHPGSLESRLGRPAPIPVGPLELAVGVPADLLRRRADIRRAERELAAQTARIGVAEAELYPKLRLFGNIGLSSDDLLSLFSRPAAVFSIGPSLEFNVFDRDRLHAAVTIENARQEQALFAYEKSVLLALEEVENAMTDFVRQQIRRDSLERALVQARRALELSREQYRQGLVDFQGVIESQRSLFTLEEQLAVNSSAISTAMIRLYQALGGGWEHFEVAQPAPDTGTESGR